MSWNPASGIGMFEPGCIKCNCCGFKPDDPWDDCPDGFVFAEDRFFPPQGDWLCTDCFEKEMEDRKCI